MQATEPTFFPTESRLRIPAAKSSFAATKVEAQACSAATEMLEELQRNEAKHGGKIKPLYNKAPFAIKIYACFTHFNVTNSPPHSLLFFFFNKSTRLQRWKRAANNRASHVFLQGDKRRCQFFSFIARCPAHNSTHLSPHHMHTCQLSSSGCRGRWAVAREKPLVEHRLSVVACAESSSMLSPI